MTKDYSERRMQNVVQAGTQLQILETMLEMLAERFDTCSERDSAALSRQIQTVIDQIEAIKAEKQPKTDEFDEFLEGLEL